MPWSNTERPDGKLVRWVYNYRSIYNGVYMYINHIFMIIYIYNTYTRWRSLLVGVYIEVKDYIKYEGQVAAVVSIAHIGTHGHSILVDAGRMLDMVPQLGLGSQVFFIEAADCACRHGTNESCWGKCAHKPWRLPHEIPAKISGLCVSCADDFWGIVWHVVTFLLRGIPKSALQVVQHQAGAQAARLGGAVRQWDVRMGGRVTLKGNSMNTLT